MDSSSTTVVIIACCILETSCALVTDGTSVITWSDTVPKRPWSDTKSRNNEVKSKVHRNENRVHLTWQHRHLSYPEFITLHPAPPLSNIPSCRKKQWWPGKDKCSSQWTPPARPLRPLGSWDFRWTHCIRLHYLPHERVKVHSRSP